MFGLSSGEITSRHRSVPIADFVTGKKKQRSRRAQVDSGDCET